MMPFSRRTILKATAGSAGCLVLGITACSDAEVAESTDPIALTAWLEIAPGDTVTIYTSQSEMGQGVLTALPMVVAEELGVPWELVHTVMADNLPAFENGRGGRRTTSRSDSISGGFAPMRQAGAAAREMLVAAAAKRWNVAAEHCTADLGIVRHKETGQEVSYGALAAEAAQLPIPENPQLKDRADWSLIGQSVPRTDIRDKVTGQTVFGMDVAPDNVLTATLQTCPTYGGRLASVDAAPAMQIKGVIKVVPLDNAVAVIADGYWQALKGLQALAPKWELSDVDAIGDKDISETLSAALATDGETGRKVGDTEAAFTNAAQTVEADYSVPYLAHACMEPMNATVHVREGEVEVWAPTQSQTKATAKVAQALGVAPETVLLHTTFMGGGFGRRSYEDFCVKAALVAREVDRPVKLIWSREEDMAQDYFRPAVAARYRAALDENGAITGLEAVLAGASMGEAFGVPPRMHTMINVGGASGDAYGLSALRLAYSKVALSIPFGIWRATSLSHNGFFIESFIDDIAAASGQSPLTLRQTLAKDSPRALGVLNQVAEMSGFGKGREPGRGLGLSLTPSWGSFCAIVVDASVNSDQDIAVHKIYAAVDCGIVVNPDIVRAQIEGGSLFGLSAAMWGKMGFENSQALDVNFDTYKILPLSEAPEIEVDLVASDEDSGGVGELATACLPAAFTNAIHAASGTRVAHLPVAGQGYGLRRG